VKGNAGKCAYHVTVNGELTRKVQRFGFGLMDAMRGKTKVQVKATESGVMCILPQALFSNLHWGGKFAGHVLLAAGLLSWKSWPNKHKPTRKNKIANKF